MQKSSGSARHQCLLKATYSLCCLQPSTTNMQMVSCSIASKACCSRSSSWLPCMSRAAHTVLITYDVFTCSAMQAAGPLGRCIPSKHKHSRQIAQHDTTQHATGATDPERCTPTCCGHQTHPASLTDCRLCHWCSHVPTLHHWESSQ